LADTANLFFNENGKDIVNEMKFALAEGFGNVFLDIFNKIVSSRPYEEFFLE
jgi:hypothetical protein